MLVKNGIWKNNTNIDNRSERTYNLNEETIIIHRKPCRTHKK